jgi:glycerophosphoryl diester phosphodiesterase
MPQKLPLIIAHRGESFDAPENTMAAFDLAWQRGDSAIELDVHLTSDGHAIVCHDDDTFRTTGNKTKLIIKDTPFKDLQHLDVGSWKSPLYANEKIPLLRDVLKKMPKGKIAFIEFKPPSIESVLPIIDVMKQSARANSEMRMICFHDPVVAEYKRLWPTGPDAYLLAHFTRNKDSNEWTPTTDQLLSRAKACHADGLDLQNAPPFDEPMLQKIHAAGLPCYVWTEDDADAARRYMNIRVDGITTNRAQWIGERLNARV